MMVLRDKVAALPSPEFGTMSANEFILYRSETLPDGPRYTPLSKLKLLKSDPAAVLAQSEEIKARYAKLFKV